VGVGDKVVRNGIDERKRGRRVGLGDGIVFDSDVEESVAVSGAHDWQICERELQTEKVDVVVDVGRLARKVSKKLCVCEIVCMRKGIRIG